MAAVGYLGYRRTNSGDQYSVASRGFGISVSTGLFAGSFVGAGTFIALAGFAYQYGLAFILVYAFGWAIAIAILQLGGSRLRRWKWSTTPQLYAARFDSSAMRVWMGCFTVIYVGIFIVFGLEGLGTFLNVLLHIPYLVGVLLMGGVMLLYVGLGGMFSVAWMNVVQFAMLWLAGVGSGAVALIKIGGPSTWARRLSHFAHDTHPAGFMLTLDGGHAIALIKIISLMLALVTAVCSAIWLHRPFFTAKNNATALAFPGVSLLLIALLCVGILFQSTTTRLLEPNLSNPEASFPTFLTILPLAISAMILVAVIAAAMSSIDSQLLAASVVVSEDLYEPLTKRKLPGKSSMRLARTTTAVVAVVTTGVAAWRPGEVISIYNFFLVVTSCVLFPPLVLGLFSRRVTKQAALSGSIVGFVAATIWYLVGPAAAPATIVIMPLVFLLMGVISYFTKPPSPKALEKFFTSAGLSSNADQVDTSIQTTATTGQQ